MAQSIFNSRYQQQYIMQLIQLDHSKMIGYMRLCNRLTIMHKEHNLYYRLALTNSMLKKCNI